MRWQRAQHVLVEETGDDLAPAVNPTVTSRTTRNDHYATTRESTTSTYMYLECTCHNPPLRAEDESGQHFSDLPRIRAELADRETVAAEPDYYAPTGNDDYDMAAYFRAHSAHFLAAHPSAASSSGMSAASTAPGRVMDNQMDIQMDNQMDNDEIS